MSRVGAWSGAGALTLGAVLFGLWLVGLWNVESSDVGSSDVGSSDVGGARLDAAAPDGEQLFTVKGCSACHVGPDSTAAAYSSFPPLDTAAQWAGDRQPGIGAQDHLAQSMVAPDAFISPVFRPGQAGPTGAMPVLTLTAEEVDSLVGYLLEQ